MKRMTNLEKRRSAADKAMPEVKKIVRRHGRTAVQNCINRLHSFEKKAKELERVRREAKRLERELSK